MSALALAASIRVSTLGIGPEVGVRSPDSHYGARVRLDLFFYRDSDLYSCRYTDSNPTTEYDVYATSSGTVRLLNGSLTGD